MVTLPHRARGVKVLKAVSSSIRLQILNLLFDRGSLSYTELMNCLKLNPNRDAGRFAYHLKFLLKADLVEVDVEVKKYFLTGLGKMVLDVADRVEKKAFSSKSMVVRTSHFTLEEFDQNKIANSLIKEAKVPPELAQKAAKEAEGRLFKSKTKYITAALIREVVNGILVEKGFEEYRHKLTRVGMPVHEVTAYVEAKECSLDASGLLAMAGQNLLGEYALLNVFPRDIADAHLSGSINIADLGAWILKPSEVFHDMRFFFLNGLQLDDIAYASVEPPKTFESALSIAQNVLLHSGRETSYQQVFSYFNTFLAPYIDGVDEDTIKNALRIFILNIHQHAQVTLGIDLSVPKALATKTAIKPPLSQIQHETPQIQPKQQQQTNSNNANSGSASCKYGDYEGEIRLLADLILQVYHELTLLKPLMNPRLVIKANSEILNDKSFHDLLIKAHTLAAHHGMLYFACDTAKDASNVFSSSGVKLAPDLTGDWETDTLRTGCLGNVTINLPRIAQETTRGDKEKFFDILKERYDLATRALSIKYNILKQFGKKHLPFLLKSPYGDTYFRLENCSRLINFAGLPEAVEIFTGKTVNEPESQTFIDELTQNVSTYRHKIGRKHGKRLYNTILCYPEASERLAQLDIEKYGIAKVKFSGTRDKPFYSTSKHLKLKTDSLSLTPEDLALAQKISELSKGGSLNIIELDTHEITPIALLDLTRHLIASRQPLEFFTYNRIVTYCRNCKKSWFGTLHKCPNCSSINPLGTFDQFNTRLTNLFTD
ncbi:MAG: ArsR family transcriptional regulator [Nitrososphaerota archaeon]|jgi:ribonucleoside-triphosphate reductase|nr:ArsR family transcriptional regulator [Nitrososphaerota archaeon]